VNKHAKNLYTMPAFFLSPADLCELTGYVFKDKQIAQLRKQGIPFFVNASGHAKVARSAVEGKKQEPLVQRGWTPAVLQIIHGPRGGRQ
jgi:hypothetical protein